MKEADGAQYSPEQLEQLSLIEIQRLRDHHSGRRDKGVRSIPLVRQERKGHVPLSYSQERLWFLDQLGLVGAAYNLPVVLRLSGALNVPALERSLAALLERHEVLRTRLESASGVPIQVIEPLTRFSLPIRSLADLPEAQQLRQVQRLIDAEVNRPFDLKAGPLLRTALLELAEQEYILLLVVHHIVADGWSLAILRGELRALYDAYSQERASPLQAPCLQYADYAIWQRRWLDGEVLQQQLRYWRERLAGAPPELQLPFDRPRPAIASFKGAIYKFVLTGALRAALEQLARKESCTLFMVMMAAYQLLLSRYGGQRDVVIGSVVAGRTHAMLEDLIGPFVNTLIFRTDLSGNPTFRELLRRVKDVAMGAYAHQDLPFEKLVKELRPERSLTRQPIFQAVLSFQNFPKEEVGLGGLSWSTVDAAHVTATFDLTLHLSAEPQGFGGFFEYATDLFDRSTIERMATHLVKLLEQISRDPDRAIELLPLLTAADREQVLRRFNDTARPYARDCTIHELFEDRVRCIPDVPAAIYEDREISYLELNRQANRLAGRLRECGVRPDSRVGILCERSIEMVVAWLAVLKAGGAYVPLDVSYPVERLAYMVRDSAPVVLLVQRQLQEKRPASTVPVIILDAPVEGVVGEVDDAAAADIAAADVGLQPQHLAYVIYTSGSTGMPKGVLVEHRNVVNLIHWQREQFDLQVGSLCSCVAAVGFDAAGWEIWPTLSSGGTLVLAPPRVVGDADAFLQWWSTRPLDISFVPTPIAELAFSREVSNPTLRALLVGGDRLRRRPASASYSLINNYGPTETTIIVTSGRISDQDPVLHIGRPIANTQIYILDSHHQPVPVGATGEIYIGGAGVSRGYLNRPELTAERYVRDPFGADPQARMYRSGDLGRWRADGTIECLGRNDDQVKIRGYRIELGEIEAQLVRHERVKEAVVVAREDVPGDKRLVAYFTATDHGGPSAEELRAHLKAALPAYMVPSAFVVLPALPLTPNGKLSRESLPVPQLDAYASREYEPPQDEVESTLAEIWQLLLHVERVGRHDNFFELGGHSLLATRVIARIREVLQIEPPLRVVFDAPTVAQLAERVKVAADTEAAREALRVRVRACELQEQIDGMGDEAVAERIAELEAELSASTFERSHPLQGR